MESHLLCLSNKKVAAVPAAGVSNCLVRASAGLCFSPWACSQRTDSLAAAKRRTLTELFSHSPSQRFAKRFLTPLSLTPATAQVQNPPEHVRPPVLYPSSVTGFATMPHFSPSLEQNKVLNPQLFQPGKDLLVNQRAVGQCCWRDTGPSLWSLCFWWKIRSKRMGETEMWLHALFFTPPQLLVSSPRLSCQVDFTFKTLGNQRVWIKSLSVGFWYSTVCEMWRPSL